MRYIAAKNNLAGKTEEEKIQVAILECEAYDMRIAYAILCYDPNFVSPMFLTPLHCHLNTKFIVPQLYKSKFSGNFITCYALN
ncbi:UNVERIFIED_CONTAM: hypothetical protein GTU68_024177 [Idotea baltica]|nr:hypothetical protein [Idotea baltica]